jgi:hypothetical protein
MTAKEKLLAKLKDERKKLWDERDAMRKETSAIFAKQRARRGGKLTKAEVARLGEIRTRSEETWAALRANDRAWGELTGFYAALRGSLSAVKE